MRLAVAGFMQETLSEMASKKKKAGGKGKDGTGEHEDAAGAKEVSDRVRWNKTERQFLFFFAFEVPLIFTRYVSHPLLYSLLLLSPLLTLFFSLSLSLSL